MGCETGASVGVLITQPHEMKWSYLALVLVFLSFVGCERLASDSSVESKVTTEGRDPWLWPFRADSIWNQPIGDEAVYEPVDLVPSKRVGIDVKHFLVLDPANPEREVIGFERFAPPEGALLAPQT
ncbi:MAG: hypothetical protein AAGA58_19155 [Verrucomicrobiota bacterium]